MRLSLALLVTAPGLAAAQLLPSPTPERCLPASSVPTPAAWLGRATTRVMPTDDGRVLRYRVAHDVPFWEQSDRMYPPFIPNIQSTIRWHIVGSQLEARHPIERAVTTAQYPSQILTGTGAYAGRDTSVRAIPGDHGSAGVFRRQNPWMVLAEWRADAGSLQVDRRCWYRDA